MHTGRTPRAVLQTHRPKILHLLSPGSTGTRHPSPGCSRGHNRARDIKRETMQDQPGGTSGPHVSLPVFIIRDNTTNFIGRQNDALLPLSTEGGEGIHPSRLPVSRCRNFRRLIHSLSRRKASVPTQCFSIRCSEIQILHPSIVDSLGYKDDTCGTAFSMSMMPQGYRMILTSLCTTMCIHWRDSFGV